MHNLCGSFQDRRIGNPHGEFIATMSSERFLKEIQPSYQKKSKIGKKYAFIAEKSPKQAKIR
jgi:hypothetical protein